MEILLGILAVLGMSFASQGVTDLMNGAGNFASQKWRAFAQKLRKLINDNQQALADYKNLNAEQKSALLTSLIASSGLGARADALRKDYERIKREEAEYTKKINDENDKYNRQIDEAEKMVSASQQGFIGQGQAYFTPTGDPEIDAQYKGGSRGNTHSLGGGVSNLSQNINGGLTGKGN